MKFEAFTDQEWESIRAVLPTEEPRHRRGIESIGQAFWIMRESRLQLGRPVEIRKRLESLQRQSRELQEALRALPDGLRSSAPHPDLDPLDRWLEVVVMIFGVLSGPQFSRNRDLYREWLYDALLDHWEGQLGGTLSFSRKPDGTPYGPLIDFLILTVKAVVGKAPGPSGIAKVIDQYRKTRDFPD
jgi:hypothetical protein